MCAGNIPEGKWGHDLFEQLAKEPEQKKKRRFNLYVSILCDLSSHICHMVRVSIEHVKRENFLGFAMQGEKLEVIEE